MTAKKFTRAGKRQKATKMTRGRVQIRAARLDGKSDWMRGEKAITLVIEDSTVAEVIAAIERALFRESA